MFTAPHRSRTLSLVAALVAVAAAQAQLPPDRQVAYKIPANPADPGSPIGWTLLVDVRAVARDGDAIGWQVVRVEIETYDELGCFTGAWKDEFPGIQSPDGLWWVTHADADNPSPADNWVLPFLIGQAESADPQAADLDYCISGLSTGEIMRALLDYFLQTEDPLDPIAAATGVPTTVALVE